MWKSCSRHARLFSTTPKPPRSTTTIQTTKPDPKLPKTLFKTVQSLLTEKDSQALLAKFKHLSQSPHFRDRGNGYYKLAINRLAVANQLPLVEEALDSQKKYCVNEMFTSRIIHLYGRYGMFDHAYKVFDEMPEKNCSQGVTSFNALLGAASNSGKYDKVLELFRELPEKLSIMPNVVSYNAVMHAMCKLGLVEDAVLLLDEMEKNGLEPDVVSYNTLLCVYYEGGGDCEEGDKLWERMIKYGKLPDTRSYNAKLKGMVMSGKLVEALELAMQLKNKGVEPNVFTYNVVIAGLIKEDDLDSVKEWYEKMVKSGCQPNRTMFSTLVPFLCQKGDYELAFQVCLSMLKDRYCLIDEDALQNVVNVLVKNSMVGRAKKLVKLGLGHRYNPYKLVLPVGV